MLDMKHPISDEVSPVWAFGTRIQRFFQSCSHVTAVISLIMSASRTVIRTWCSCDLDFHTSEEFRQNSATCAHQIESVATRDRTPVHAQTSLPGLLDFESMRCLDVETDFSIVPVIHWTPPGARHILFAVTTRVESSACIEAENVPRKRKKNTVKPKYDGVFDWSAAFSSLLLLEILTRGSSGAAQWRQPMRVPAVTLSKSCKLSAGFSFSDAVARRSLP